MAQFMEIKSIKPTLNQSEIEKNTRYVKFYSTTVYAWYKYVFTLQKSFE